MGSNLCGFSGMVVRSGGAGRFRDSVSPNGMELPLSLVCGLTMMRHIVGVRVVDDAVINDKRTSIPFCPKTRCVNSQERDEPERPSVDSREKACKTEPPSRQCAG